jgi:hypothetical protein
VFNQRSEASDFLATLDRMHVQFQKVIDLARLKSEQIQSKMSNHGRLAVVAQLGWTATR